MFFLHLSLFVISVIVMNSRLNRDSPQSSRRIDRLKRFNRTQDQDSVSIHKRAISQFASQSNILKFYKPGAQYTKDRNFLEDLLRSLSPACQQDDIIVASKKKPKTLTQRFTVDRESQLDPQKQSLKSEVKRLKMKNRQLQSELINLKALVQNRQNKQNKPMNKMRQKTQKQRLKQLQNENNHLKQTINQLNDELREIKSSRFTEETNISSNDINFELQQKNDSNSKQIFTLCEQIKRLQIQMDFLNRRNYGQIYNLKMLHDKQIKSLKDKITQISKSNSQLKKKNNELIYTIKGTRQKHSYNCEKYSRDRRESDLLELSCSD